MIGRSKFIYDLWGDTVNTASRMESTGEAGRIQVTDRVRETLEPEFLLLDEPCAGMNSEEKQDMIFWIKDIQDTLGVTILLIEHDMKMVMDISERILVINFGKIITEGPPEAVQKNPDVLKAYLGEDDGISAVA